MLVRHFISCSKLLLYSGYFEEENFHEFHKSIAICESFTLKMFTESTYYQVFLMISETFPFEINPVYKAVAFATQDL